MIFDVKDYGAVGDGQTDDTTAIQAALDAAAGVGRVFFPAGDYLVGSDPIVPSRSNIKGENATLHVTRKGAAAALAVNPGTDNVIIAGMELRGPWYGIDTATYVGGGDLEVWNAEYAENTAIDIRGRWYQREVLQLSKAEMLALTDESRHITVKRCTIEGFGQSGILADQVTDFTAEKNHIYRNGRDGIRTYGVVDGLIEKNRIGDMFAAYADGDAPNFNMYGVATTRLYGKAGYEDPDLTIGRPSRDIKISRNFIKGLHTWKGLDTHGGVSIQFVDNIIEDCNIGIGLDKGGFTDVHGIAPARDITISGNTFRQTRQSRYMRAAITVYGHDTTDNQLLDGVVITSNIFRDWGGGDTDSCISVSNATGVIIGSNRFKNPRLSAIRFTQRVDGFTCDTNIIDNPVGYCTISLTSGGSGYTTRPNVTVSGGGGTGMRVYAKISGGVVTSLKMLHPGFGYTSAPTLTISGGGGSGAAGTALFNAPFGVQIGSGQVRGTIDTNDFSGRTAYDSIRLATPLAGYSVSVGADNTFAQSAARPSPPNLVTGSIASTAQAWANVSLIASGAFLRASLGVASVTRTARGVVRLTLTRPLSSNVRAAATASAFSGNSATAATSVIDPLTIEVAVRDAWQAPADVSFYVSVTGY